MDTIGKPIGNEVFFDYLDLNGKRDSEFGQKKPIPMPNPATRSFMAEVTEVAFTNNSVWVASENAWNSLDALVSLEQALGNHEVVKQYRMRFGANAKYQPQKDNGLWRCTCGAFNNAQEENCHACGCSANALFTCNYEELKAESTVRIEQEREAEKKESKKRKKIAAIVIPVVIICIAAFVLYTKVLVPSRNYNQAVALLEEGQYEAAIAAFEALGDYKDSTQQVIEAQRGIDYNTALSYEKAGAYERAIVAYSKIPDFKDASVRIEVCQEAIYLRANEFQTEGKYDEAIIEYNKITEYKDSRDRIASCQNSIYERAIIQEFLPIYKAYVGDIVSFGVFEQDDDLKTKDEPIKWVLIAREGNRCLLLSEACLYGGQYTNKDKPGNTIFWETSTIRKWLNGEFYDSAFSANEKKTVLLSSLVNKGYVYESDLPWGSYTSKDGNNTKDHVFLLSIEEVETYLINNPLLFKYLPASVTRYAGHSLGKDNVDGYGTASRWWTRTPGDTNNEVLCMAFPYTDNSVYNIYSEKCYREKDPLIWSPGVRPAIWVDLSIYEDLLRQ